MDKMEDSGSFDMGSIPVGVTFQIKKKTAVIPSFFIYRIRALQKPYSLNINHMSMCYLYSLTLK